MGADVAAGPHCPFAVVTEPGRQGFPRGRFRDRAEPGVRTPSSGVLQRPKPWAGFPAGSPSGPKPWRFAAWQIWNSRPASRHRAALTEVRVRLRQDPRPKPRFCLTGHGPKSWVPPVRSSRAEARSCPTALSRSSGSAGGGALTCVPLSAGQVLDRSPLPACPVPPARRLLVPGGRFTKPAAFASAKGQARSFRLAAASSAAPPLRRRLTAW